ncbi:MAG: DUF1365 domain-containing protein [Candidatus Eisenbacteria bacterium]
MTPPSALYFGRVRHRRHAPRAHDFSYPLFLTWLDLGALDDAFAGHPLWSTSRPALARFDRRDYFGDPAVPLDRAVRELVRERTGRAPEGPVRLLTHLRMFGVAFNPVSFYYCYDRADERIEAIVAEVSNTPWNERHLYVLDARGRGGKLAFAERKEFHVSPFLPMDLVHHFRFSPPGERLAVHMEDHGPDGRVFDATLTLERRDADARTLTTTLLRYPFMTLQVLAAIYWQALRLWLKRIPYHPHPRDAERAHRRSPA